MKVFILGLLDSASVVIGAAAPNASALKYCDTLWSNFGSPCLTAGATCAQTTCYGSPYWHASFTTLYNSISGLACFCQCCDP
jgi:hypothetical protein